MSLARSIASLLSGGGGALLPSNNLSDISNAATALSNLGGVSNTSQIAGNRNKIINGGMQVSQRGTSIAAVSTDFTYTADRWAITRGGTINYTQGTSSPPTGFQCYAQYINQSAGNPFLSVIQVIESVNTYDLIGQTVTLSAWIKAAANTSGSTAASLSCGYATTADARLTAFVGAGQSLTLSSSSWARYTYTFTVPSNALTLAATISLGTMAVGDGLLITGVQLEKGATATPFENRLYGTELALCQRYYEKSYNIDVVPGTSYILGNGLIAPSSALAASTAGNVSGGNSIPFKVTKRASPTMQVYDFDGTANAVRVQITVDGKRTGVTQVYNIQTSGAFQLIIFDATSGTPIAQGSALVFSWTASAEL